MRFGAAAETARRHFACLYVQSRCSLIQLLQTGFPSSHLTFLDRQVRHPLLTRPRYPVVVVCMVNIVWTATLALIWQKEATSERASIFVPQSREELLVSLTSPPASAARVPLELSRHCDHSARPRGTVIAPQSCSKKHGPVVLHSTIGPASSGVCTDYVISRL
jgi:hypothetical protein